MSFSTTLKQEFWRTVKYCVVGVGNTAITYTVFSLGVHIGVPAHVSLAFGYAAGLVTSYIGNSSWTFNYSRRSRRSLTLFFALNLIVLLISELTLTGILHSVTPNRYRAQLINTPLVVVLGFLVNRILVFR